MAFNVQRWFEAPEVRRWVAAEARFTAYRAAPTSWPDRRQAVYAAMADHVAEHVNLAPLRNHIGL